MNKPNQFTEVTGKSKTGGFKKLWFNRLQALKLPMTYIYILSGIFLIIGLILPGINFLFYIGFLLPFYKTYIGEITDQDIFYFVFPYCMVLGIGVWNHIFPYYTGILIALTLPDLFARLIMKCIRLFESGPVKLFAIPVAIFFFDFTFSNLPFLKHVHVIPILASIYNHTFLLATSSLVGSHITLFIIMLAIGSLTAIAADRSHTIKKLIILIISGLIILTPHIIKTGYLKGYDNEKPVIVAAVQGRIMSNQSFGDNFTAFSKFIMDRYSEIINDEKADIYVFPETLSGVYDSSKPLTQDNLKEVINFAKKRDAMLLCLVIEKNLETNKEDTRFMTAVLADPSGVVGMSQKRYLVPFSESRRYNRGKDFSVFETKYGKIGISICYDTNFDTVVKLKKNGAELILAPFNDYGFGKVYHNIHRYYPVINAIQCNVPVAQANYDGISQLITADGRVVKDLGYQKEGVISYGFNIKPSPSFYVSYGIYLEWMLYGFIILILIYGFIKQKNSSKVYGDEL